MLLSDILIKIKAAGGDPDGAKITKDQFPCYNDGVTGVNCTYGVPESNDSYNKQLIIYQQKLAKYRLWVQTELPGLLIAQQASTAKELEALELAASEARARLNNC
jgi:hypothetical protein